MRRLLLLPLIAALPFAAIAQVKPDGSPDSLITVSKGAIALCSLSAMSELSAADLEVSRARLQNRAPAPNPEAGETSRCIEKEKARFAEFYRAFTSRYEKNARALESGRQYFASALTTLEGVKPMGGERQFQYDARQRGNRQRMSELESLLRVDAL